VTLGEPTFRCLVERPARSAPPAWPRRAGPVGGRDEDIEVVGSTHEVVEVERDRSEDCTHIIVAPERGRHLVGLLEVRGNPD